MFKNRVMSIKTYCYVYDFCVHAFYFGVCSVCGSAHIYFPLFSGEGTNSSFWKTDDMLYIIIIACKVCMIL